MNNISVILLAAGIGSRLRPFTDVLPKCLMPIQGVPLLEIWIENLLEIGLSDILVNLHYKKEEVEIFLERPKYKNKIKKVYEKNLLGTAGTICKNHSFVKNKISLLIHADNLCLCDFKKFIQSHLTNRNSNTSITMMSFRTNSPETCGILEVDSNGVVVGFHEKVKNPPGNLANAAIYLIEPNVIEWIVTNNKKDFSNEVIPEFINKISSWENKSVMIDIGSPDKLKFAQTIELPFRPIQDDWTKSFSKHEIHSMISNNLK